MQYRHYGYLAILVILAVVLAGGCVSPMNPGNITGASPTITSPVPTTGPVIHNATREEMVAFVQRAVAYAKSEGKEKALAEFDRKNGSFFDGQLYIYAYDWDGITIAHPVNPEKIGLSRLYEKDAKGNLFIMDLRDTARNGSGFVEYYYINPVHNNTVEKKLGYVMKVDDTWWLGSGIYYGV